MNEDDPKWVKSDFRVRGYMLGLLNKYPTLFLLALGVGFAAAAILVIGTLVFSFELVSAALSLMMPKAIAGLLSLVANTAFAWFCAMIWISDSFREELLTGIRKMLMSGKMPDD